MRKLRAAAVLGLTALAVVSVCAAQAGAAEGIFKEGTNVKPTKVGIKGKLLSLTNALQAKGHLTVTCTGGTLSGEVLSTATAEVTETFTGCEAEGKKCKNTTTAGEIVLKELSLLPVLEETVTGGAFEPAIRTKLLREVVFECGTTQKLKVTGDFLALIPAEAETEKGWSGTNSEGLLFHYKAKQTEGKEEGTGKYRESVGGIVKTAQLLMTAMGTEEFIDVETGKEAELSLEFEEKVSIKA